MSTCLLRNPSLIQAQIRVLIPPSSREKEWLKLNSPLFNLIKLQLDEVRMPLPASGAARLWCTHAPSRQTCGAAHPTPGVRLPNDFSRLRVWVFGRAPQRQKSHCWKPKGEGELLRKTHPSGRGRDNFPVSGAVHTFFQTPLTPLSQTQPPLTATRGTHTAVGGSTGKGASAGSLSIRRDGEN